MTGGEGRARDAQHQAQRENQNWFNEQQYDTDYVGMRGLFAILSMESHTFTNVQIRWFFFHFHFHFDLWCNVTKFYWFPAFEANICSSWNWICTKVDMIWKTNFINGCMKNVLAIHFFLRNPFISFNTFP